MLLGVGMLFIPIPSFPVFPFVKQACQSPQSQLYERDRYLNIQWFNQHHSLGTEPVYALCCFCWQFDVYWLTKLDSWPCYIGHCIESTENTAVCEQTTTPQPKGMASAQTSTTDQSKWISNCKYFKIKTESVLVVCIDKDAQAFHREATLIQPEVYIVRG